MRTQGFLAIGAALIIAAVAVCGCAISPQSKPSKPDKREALVPAELVPEGFHPGDCWFVKKAEVTTEGGPSGSKVATGQKGAEISCKVTGHMDYGFTSVPTCRTTGGKDLPLSDCCLNADGSTIPGCTPKPQPPAE